MEVPAIDPVVSINAPSGTSRVELKMMAAALNPENQEFFADELRFLGIQYISGMRAAERVVLETGLIAGSMVVAVAALGYWDGEKRINEPGFSPAEIVLNYD